GLDRMHRLAKRDGTRRARVRGREDRPADIQSDPEIGGSGTAEDGAREIRGDRLDPALAVLRVLAPGVHDPTASTPEVDPASDPPPRTAYHPEKSPIAPRPRRSPGTWRASGARRVG